MPVPELHVNQRCHFNHQSVLPCGVRGFQGLSSGGLTDHPGFPRKWNQEDICHLLMSISYIVCLSIYLFYLQKEQQIHFIIRTMGSRPKSRSGQQAGCPRRVSVLSGSEAEFFFSRKPQFLLTRTPTGGANCLTKITSYLELVAAVTTFTLHPYSVNAGI